MDAVFGLGDEGGGPFGFDEDCVVGVGEGEADAGGGDVCDEYFDLPGLEPLDDLVARAVGGVAVVDGDGVPLLF